ncbi:MAG TPA: glycosyltransferase, partial [Dehalococcoidia bacterium]|nr:glycosyltransferase [Dehalococcoidia bacterium]
MDLPKISIVTPSYNQAEFLEATIQSLISQNYPNLEYVIIDGGSTDGSVEIIKKYEGNLHFWCSEPDGGLYDAINKGFAQTSGEIMTWLCSDDMHCPWSLKTISDIMLKVPQVEWLTTLNLMGWDRHGFLVNTKTVAGYSHDAFLDGRYCPWGKNKASAIGWIQLESTFWRRSLWERAGGEVRADMDMAAEFELWSRFFTRAELYATNSTLGGFRYQPNQKTKKFDGYAKEAESVMSAARESADWRPSKTRRILRSQYLAKIPLLRRLILRKYGYLG